MPVFLLLLLLFPLSASAEDLVDLSANPFDSDSTANPFGAGSPFNPDGINNPFSNQSATNPFATDAPRLLARLSGLFGNRKRCQEEFLLAGLDQVGAPGIEYLYAKDIGGGLFLSVDDPPGLGGRDSAF